ncbi:MAG: dihydrofolate reductase family protein [Actinomycetota bacterium]
MSKVTSEISVSLDGFVTGPNVGASNPLGDEGERLHDWMFSEKTEADAEIREEVYATTGAILLGRRMFDLGVGPWGDPPPFRMPVFVLTHKTRDPQPMQGGAVTRPESIGAT